MAYSRCLRERVMAAVKEGAKQPEVAERFKVSLSSVERYVRGERRAECCSGLGGKEKKRLAASGQDPEVRAAWWQAFKELESAKLVFIDDAGTHTAMTRTYARAAKGQCAYGNVSRPRGGNITLLAALSWGQLQAEWVIKGEIDGEGIVTWLKQVLLPILTPGQPVVMGNIKAYYRKEVCSLTEAHGCDLLSLPPYLADLSPIELAFSQTRCHLKSFAARSEQELSPVLLKPDALPA